MNQPPNKRFSKAARIFILKSFSIDYWFQVFLVLFYTVVLVYTSWDIVLISPFHFKDILYYFFIFHTCFSPLIGILVLEILDRRTPMVGTSFEEHGTNALVSRPK